MLDQKNVNGSYFRPIPGWGKERDYKPKKVDRIPNYIKNDSLILRLARKHKLDVVKLGNRGILIEVMKRKGIKI